MYFADFIEKYMRRKRMPPSSLRNTLAALFLAPDVIYTSHAYLMMPVSVCLRRCALWSQGAINPGYFCTLG